MPWPPAALAVACGKAGRANPVVLARVEQRGTCQNSTDQSHEHEMSELERLLRTAFLR